MGVASFLASFTLLTPVPRKQALTLTGWIILLAGKSGVPTMVAQYGTMQKGTRAKEITTKLLHSMRTRQI